MWIVYYHVRHHQHPLTYTTMDKQTLKLWSLYLDSLKLLKNLLLRHEIHKTWTRSCQIVICLLPSGQKELDVGLLPWNHIYIDLIVLTVCYM